MEVAILSDLMAQLHQFVLHLREQLVLHSFTHASLHERFDVFFDLIVELVDDLLLGVFLSFDLGQGSLLLLKRADLEVL